MQNKKQKLMDIMGFSDKKATIYLALLESGEASATYLSRKCGLKRTTIYNILPELQDEGLIKTTKRGGRIFYYVEDTRDLERIIETKAKSLHDLLPELQKVQNVLSLRPKIILYEGEGGMKQLYQEIIDSVPAGGKILTYIGLQDFENYISKEVVSEYVSQRISKKIVNRVLAFKNPESEKWLRTAPSELREMKILKEETEPFSSDMKIFNNKVAFLSYKENFFSVVIESREIATLLRSAFEVIWRKTE